MKKLPLAIVFITIAFNFADSKYLSSVSTPVATCIEDDSTDNKGICTFYDLSLANTKIKFESSNYNNQYIYQIGFVNSKIKEIGPELCLSFPNLKILLLENLDIVKVTQDAFEFCKVLSQLSLASNLLSQLSDNIFR